MAGLALLAAGAAALAALTLVREWSPPGSRDLPEMAAEVPPPLAARTFPERKWLHRVNSLERARSVEDRHRGLEMDVVFDPDGGGGRGTFDVGHPPSPSTGLALDRLIGGLKEPRRHWYWIDLKNLDPRNKRRAAEALREISSRFGILERMVVESSCAACLGEFSDLGFYTSFYIPQTDPYRLGKEELRAHLESIAAPLRSSRVNALSSGHLQYEFLSKYFPGYDYLLWYPTRRRLRFMVRERKLLRDPAVKVLLFHESSPGYR